MDNINWTIMLRREDTGTVMVRTHLLVEDRQRIVLRRRRLVLAVVKLVWGKWRSS